MKPTCDNDCTIFGWREYESDCGLLHFSCPEDTEMRGDFWAFDHDLQEHRLIDPEGLSFIVVADKYLEFLPIDQIVKELEASITAARESRDFQSVIALKNQVRRLRL